MLKAGDWVRRTKHTDTRAWVRDGTGDKAVQVCDVSKSGLEIALEDILGWWSVENFSPVVQPVLDSSHDTDCKVCRESSSPVLCAHANENPRGPCACPANCYCRRPSGACPMDGPSPALQDPPDNQVQLPVVPPLYLRRRSVFEDWAKYAITSSDPLTRELATSNLLQAVQRLFAALRSIDPHHPVLKDFEP